MKFNFLIFILTICFFNFSFADNAYFTDLKNLPEKEMAERLGKMILSSHTPITSIKKIREEKDDEDCFVETIRILSEDPITRLQQKLEILVYFPHDGFAQVDLTPKGNLVVVPTIVGISPLETNFASLACSRQFKTVVIKSWDGDDIHNTDLDAHDKYTLRALVAIRHILDYLGEPAQILGTSLGSLYSSVAFATDDRLFGAVLMVGGADLPTILVNSQERRVKALREKRFEIYGFKNNDEYLSALKENIHFTPELFINEKAKQKPLMMVRDLVDQKVPTENQQRLVQMWDPDVIRYTSHGHVRSILDMYLLNQTEIIRFFEKNLTGRLPK